MIALTSRAGQFVSSLRFDTLPHEAVGIVTAGMIDCCATIILGSTQPVSAILSRALVPAGDAATALWGRVRTGVDHAALLDATASHALDYDDTGLDGHPSAVLFPTVLAVGEATGAGGRDLVAAYVAGYEVWAELVMRDADKLHAKGFHPSGIYGAVAAAAASANLMRLDPDRAAAALSIAASMAGGLVANFGSMTKPYQLGRAAQNGVLAARLASEGMTAAADGLEHPVGFLHAFSPRGQVDLLREPSFGSDWWILREGLNIKLYPICYAAHRLVDSALALHAGVRERICDIAAIRAHLGRKQSQILRNAAPVDGTQAKFSAEFAVAAALLEGRVGNQELADAYVARTATVELMRRVARVESDDADPDQPLFSPGDHVEIDFANGETLRGPAVRYARGHARNPATPADVRTKFAECTSALLDPARQDALIELLAHPERIGSVRDLYRA